MKLLSFVSDTGSLARLGAKPFKRRISIKSTPDSCSAACDAPSSVSTAHAPLGMRRAKRAPSSAEGMSASASETMTKARRGALLGFLPSRRSESVVPKRSSAPGAFTDAHPSASTPSLCASVSRGMMAESCPSAGKRRASSSAAAASPAGVTSCPRPRPRLGPARGGGGGAGRRLRAASAGRRELAPARTVSLRTAFPAAAAPARPRATVSGRTTTPGSRARARRRDPVVFARRRARSNPPWILREG